MITITPEKTAILKEHGLDFYTPNRPVASDFSFEPPCSLKFAVVEHGCYIGAFSYIVSGFLCGVRIGRYCSFGENVQIGRQNHPIHWLSTSPFLYLNNAEIVDVNKAHMQTLLTETPVYPKAATRMKKTIIKNDVWIGQGAIINAGTTIENGAIIAAGAVVTKNVPAYAIVGGNPAQVIRFRFKPEIIESLEKIKWWRYGPDQLKNLPVHNVKRLINVISKNNRKLLPYKPTKYELIKIFSKQ